MMKEGALRKKLQELGIPNWGNKDLMRRRHIEWLNIYNSNCDADEKVRRPKRQLLKELDEWETTQGGRADVKESKVMRKDFDGSGYAKSHKTDFDGLIAQARKKRAAPKPAEGGETNGDGRGHAQEEHQPSHEVHAYMQDVPIKEEQPLRSTQVNGSQYQGPETHLTHPGTPQESAHEPNYGKSDAVQQQADPSGLQKEPPLGLQNPLGSPTRKVPMFAMSEDPVQEVDMSTT